MDKIKELIDAAMLPVKGTKKAAQEIVHVPYSRAKGKSHAKQASGFHVVENIREFVPVQHPPRKINLKLGRGEPSVLEMKRSQIQAAKHAVRNAHRQAKGRHFTIDAGVRKLKAEMREIMKADRRA